MADVLNGSYTAGAEAVADHDAGVELDHPLRVEAGADAGVEDRLVLETAHGRDHGRQRTVLDRGPAGIETALDSRLALR
jgi:hypothetical protein